MRCGTCGKQNPDNNSFCFYCGAGLSEQGRRKHSLKPGRRSVLILFAAVLLIGTFAGLTAAGVVPLFSAGNGEQLFQEVARSNYIEITDESGAGTGEILVYGKAGGARWEVSAGAGAGEVDVSVLASAENALGEPVELYEEQGGGRVAIFIPEQSIEPGMPYTVTLKDGVHFLKDELRNARAVTFIPDRQDTEIIEYNNNVRQLQAGEANAVDEDTLRLPANEGIGEGNVLILPGENGQSSAYYVESVSGGFAETRIASPNEIYKQLEISGTYTVDPDDIVLSEEAIENQVRESSFLDSLVTTVYADEGDAGDLDVNVKLLPKQGGLLRVQIEITLHDGFNFRGMKKDFVLTLVLGFKAEVNVNVVGTLVFDVSSNVLVTADITGGIADDHGGTFSDFTDWLYDGGDFLKEMEDQIRNSGDGVLKIGSIPFAISPGIGVTIDLEAKFSQSLTGGLILGSDMEFGSKSGVIISPVKFKPYSKNKFDSNLDRLSGVMRYEAKAGLGGSLLFSVFNCAKVGFELEGGLYAEAAGAIKLVSDDSEPPLDRLFWYIDAGTYHELSAVAEIDYFLGKMEFEAVLDGSKTPFSKSMPLGRKKYIDSMAAETGRITVGAGGKAKLPRIFLSMCDLFDGTFETAEADYADLGLICSDGVSCDVDNKGNITFSGNLPEEFTLTVSHKGAPGVVEIICKKGTLRGISNSNLANGGMMTEDDRYIYLNYSGENTDGIDQIYVFDKATGERSKNVMPDTYGLNVYNGYLYGVRAEYRTKNNVYYDDYTIVRGELRDGFAKDWEILRQSGNRIDWFTVSEGSLYWVENGLFYKADLDGGNVTEIGKANGDVAGFCIEDGYIWYGVHTAYEIVNEDYGWSRITKQFWRMRTDGTGAGMILETQDMLIEEEDSYKEVMIIEDSRLYFILYTADAPIASDIPDYPYFKSSLMCFNPDTGRTETLVDEVDNFAIYGGNIYFCKDALYRCNMDGSGAQNINAKAEGGARIYITDGKIYVRIERDATYMQCLMNNDGSGAELIDLS